MNNADPANDAAILGCQQSCERLLVVVAAVTPEEYCALWNGRQGIGPHLRHCYEHLSALRDGLGGGSVNYDARERNPILERDPAALTTAMADITAWLDSLDPHLLDQPLRTHQIPHVDAEPTVSASSLRRELLFVTSHTIHHLALVSMLAQLHGIALPENLGVAYSTTAYEREKAARPSPTAASIG